MKPLFSGILKAGVSLALLYWLIQRGIFDTKALIAVCTPANVVLFFFLALLNAVFVSERARALIARQVSQYSFFQVFKLTIMGFFFNFAMPGGVGGDVIKGVFLVKNNSQKKGRALLALLMDRVIGLYCMIILAIVVMFLDYEHVIHHDTLRPIFFTMAAVGIALTSGAYLCFNSKTKMMLHRFLDAVPLPLKPKFHQLIDGLADFGGTPKLLALACLYSLLSQTCVIIIFYITAQTLGFVDLRFLTCFIAAPIGFIVTALPITPGGVGLGQAVFFYIFELYSGGSGIVGTTAITVIQASQFLLGLWGAYYFVRSDAHLTWTSDLEKT